MQTQPAGVPVTVRDEEDDSGSSAGEIIKWVLTIAVVVFAVGLIVLRFVYQPRYVETGSMEPEYQIGALVWVDDDAYKNAKPAVGDVAVYSNGGRPVMHRIVKDNGDGTYTFKGDNNDSDDFSPVPEKEIEGKAVFHTNLFAPIVRKLHHLSDV